MTSVTTAQICAAVQGVLYGDEHMTVRSEERRVGKEC